MQKKCFLCGSEASHIIHKGVRGNPSTNVLKCDGCGLVRLDTFPSDLEEYYRTSQMRKDEKETNLAEIRSAAQADDRRRFDFISRMIENRVYMDFGCGAGGVLSLARHKAAEVFGVEPETAMCNALNEEGIRCFESIEKALSEKKGEIDVISLFHVLEHLEDPTKYLEDLKALLSADGIIIIEVPNADDALLSLYGCNAFADFTYWESHLYLYNNKTLSSLIERTGLKVRFLGQIQRYPLSNTLYWLAKGKPGGHKEWSVLSNERLDREYESALAALGIADTVIAVIEKA